MIEIIVQIGITFFSCVAIALLAVKKPWSRWGFIIGFIGQPFWFYSTWIHDQWGMFLVTCWFTISYGIGIWNFWIKGCDLAWIRVHTFTKDVVYKSSRAEFKKAITEMDKRDI